MSDKWDQLSSATTPIRPTSDILPGTRPIARPDDPVYSEGQLPPEGYEMVVTSKAPIRIRIWYDDTGAVRFRVGRWGDMPDKRLRDVKE